MAVADVNQEVPKYILDAATLLHQEKNKDLIFGLSNIAEEIAAECNSLWKCQDGQIIFYSLEARNHCTALAIYLKLSPLINFDALFEAAYELWRKEIGHSDFASGRLFGFASQEINLLREAAQVIKNKQEYPRDVFNVLRLVGVALPYLTNLSADDVVALVDAQHEFTKRDLAGGLIFNSIEHRLRSESQIAWEICHITRGNMSDSVQNLYSTALQSLMHTDQQAQALEKSRDDADHNDPMIAGPALWTLARTMQAHELSGADLDKCVTVLMNKTSAASTEIRQAATRAVALVALKDDRLMTELVRLAAERDDYTLTVIANFLFMNQKNLNVSSPYFKPLLQSLISLAPSQTDAIDKFDWLLHELYEAPENRPLVLDFLSVWLIKHGGPGLDEKDLIQMFDQTIMRIANDKSGLQTVITRWFVAPEKQLAVACSGLISYLYIHGIKSLDFSPEVLNTFSLQDFKFLARRLLGYVISEELLLSLTFSLLETINAPERSFGLVYSLLIDEIGRDYAYATMAALKLRQEFADSPENEFLAQIYSILQQRSAANNHLHRLQEFRPPIRLQRAIAQSRAREMEQAHDVANEKSIIRQLATTVTLKAGRGWFSVSDNQVEPTQHLHSISHSISLPKRALTDPVGYAIARLYYRIAKREDE